MLNEGTTSKKKNAFKLILLGNGFVGKTSLLRRYAEDRFSDTPGLLRTLHVDFLEKKVKIRDKYYRLQLYDTAGQEQFRSFTSAFFRDTQICILVFSLTSRESLDGVDYWRNEFIRQTEVDEKTYPFVLLGNKVDDAESRDVSQRNIDSFVGLSHNMTYMETSAKTKRNVNEAFSKAVELFLEYESDSERKSSASSRKSTIDMNEVLPKSKHHGCSC